MSARRLDWLASDRPGSIAERQGRVARMAALEKPAIRRRARQWRIEGRTARSGSNGTNCGRISPRRPSSARTSRSAGGSGRASRSTYSPPPTAASRFSTIRRSVPRRPAAAASRTCRSRRCRGISTATPMARPIPTRRSCRSRRLVAPLRTLPRAPSANLQLDLKLLEGHALPDSAIADAAAALDGLADAIVVGSHHLEDARRLVAAIPGARLGYDPMLAVSRQPGPARSGAPAAPHGAAQGRREPSPISGSMP